MGFYQRLPEETSVASGKTKQNMLKKPDWLKVRPPAGARYRWIKEQSKSLKIATVCEEAKCPNIGECWTVGTVTFMVMGEVCTRGCRFCNVTSGNPNGWLDHEEPEKLGKTIADAGWDYVVITSVDRDDLPDLGAAHFARCITESKQHAPNLMVEVLIPDFQGHVEHLKTIISAQPDVIAQNIETVERLTHEVRDRRAGYQQTLDCLAAIKRLKPSVYTKSSIMLGLGETEDEVLQCMKDLKAHGVDILTLGQYLQPSVKHLPVQAYVTPEKFQEWQQIAEHELGFLYCASGPLVRSSYRAGELFMKNLLRRQHRSQKETVHVG